VLGEDDFELLYLAKSLHREGSFFVLKELFLESFSTRNGNLVETIPEALGVFEKQKKYILKETQTLQRKNLRDEIKIHGAFEENNTVYTCMVYTPNSKLEAYLQFQPKENTLLPMLDEIKNPKKRGKGKIIFSLLALILLLAGMVVFINKNAEKVMHKRDIPLLKEHKKSLKEKETTEEQAQENADQSHQEVTTVETNNSKSTLSTTEPVDKSSLWKENFSLENAIAEVEQNKTKEEEIIQEKRLELPSENNETNQTVQTEATKVIENKIATIEPKSNESNNRTTKKVEPFSQEEIKAFLETFIELSAKGTATQLSSLYDKKVDRYFKFRRIGSSKVERSIKAYNKKWSKRDFTLVSFKILKKYTKKNREYCKVKTDTKWEVSTARGKKRKGRSKGVMLLVHGEDGIKIKAIYGTK
jgi:hypothetical protein